MAGALITLRDPINISIRLEEPLPQIVAALREEGGRAFLVGGYIRDRLLDIPSKDVDIEVFGLPLERLEAVLARFGKVTRIGRAFGVLRVRGLDADFSLPRKDSKVAKGHTGFRRHLRPGDELRGGREATRRHD